MLLRDFEVGLLKHGHYEKVPDFFNATYSKLLLPHMSSPTRIMSTSANLTDNILTKDHGNTFPF